MLGWLPVTGADHYRVQVSRNRSFTDILEEVEAQFVNYVPWQGKREPIPFGTYWWRVRAEGASDDVIGDWSETRHFNLSRDIMMGNPYDFVAPDPDDGLLGSGVKYSSTLTYVAASPKNASDPYDLGALHVMMEHGDGLSWVFAFETNGNVSENIRLWYLHRRGSYRQFGRVDRPDGQTGDGGFALLP